MPLIVPTSTEQPWYRQRTTLDGRDYVLYFKWNQRNGRWYVDVFDQDERPIAVGVKLVTNFPLLRLFRDPRKPAGQLTVVDMVATRRENEANELIVSSDRDAGFCNLGTRFLVFYFESAEVAELG